MNLSEILNNLYPYLGGINKPPDFVIAVFRAIVGDDSDNPVFEKNKDMLGRIYNGSRLLSENDAKFVLNGLTTNKQQFYDYIEADDGILFEIARKFNSNDRDVADLIADLLIDELERLANKSKVRSTSAPVDIEAGEEFALSADDLFLTLNPKGFDAVFTPIACSLTNTKLFHLADIRNNAFKFDDLQKFLRRNIGRYVLARATIDKMKIDGDEEDIGAKALDLLRAAGKIADVADEVGDIILYVFLEEVLKAPKIYSKIQMTEDGVKITNQGGVHLLRSDSPANSYQLVIGKSNIVGNLQQAIDNSFIAMDSAMKNESKEMRFLDSTILTDQSFNNPRSIAYLRSVIFPQKDKTSTSTINNAFGVFLGYSLDLDKSKFATTELFRAAIIDKMQNDILSYASYIADKIKAYGMDAYSFYFYLLPFNDADNDKLSIVKVLLGGTA